MTTTEPKPRAPKTMAWASLVFAVIAAGCAFLPAAVAPLHLEQGAISAAQLVAAVIAVIVGVAYLALARYLRRHA